MKSSIDTKKHIPMPTSLVRNNNNDVNLLTQKIKEKCIAKSLFVGVVGIKSLFRGWIYDVGIAHQKFYYDGLRPFYLLAMGRQGDVEKYFRELVPRCSASSKVSGGEITTTIFGPWIAELGGQNAIAVKNKPGVTRLTSLVLPEDGSKRAGPALQFIVNEALWSQGRVDAASGVPRRALFDASVPFTLRKFSVPLEYSRSTFDFEVESQIYDEKAKKFISENSVYNALSLSGIQADPQGALKFSVCLSTSAAPLMKRKSIYRFKIIVGPKREDYGPPDWISTWNFGANDVPGPINGDKTFNLYPFLSTVWEATQQEFRPRIIEFDFYIR